MYTVKQLAQLAGISPRALHHYDEIGLLKPTVVAPNGYRQYDDAALFRLQQILLYRELDLELSQIKALLDDKDFDLVSALRGHRLRLAERAERLGTLIQTVDATIMHLVGEINMSNKKKAFQGFSEEQQKKYEEEARQNWGAENVDKSIKRWNSYSEEEKQRILEEGGAIYMDIVAQMPLGPQAAEIQAHLARWHQHLHYFYEPSLEVLRGLGDMYHDHPDFNATFTAMHPDLPAFLKQAITVYVDALEME
jgi:DNA-binding transcriptional MerR regulator